MTLYEILMINAEGAELGAAICRDQHDEENVAKWLSEKNDYIKFTIFAKNFETAIISNNKSKKYIQIKRI